MTGQYVNRHGVWFNAFNPDASGPSHVRNIRDVGYSMVCTNRFKLVVDSKTRRSTELYDLQEDPNELINLVENEDCRDQEELLNSYLDDLLKGYG